MKVPLESLFHELYEKQQSDEDKHKLLTLYQEYVGLSIALSELVKLAQLLIKTKGGLR